MNEENVQRHISKSDIQNISNELLTICNSIFDEVKSIKNIQMNSGKIPVEIIMR